MKNTVRPNDEQNFNFRIFSPGLKGTDPLIFLLFSKCVNMADNNAL